ncbi:hypothetical protein [Proteiniborus sp. MB09-C3]|uniref:hypothetical protein n=1 Tax=Proteiniborus sp. MB09-C3 TaxID=3050072 RepID=UPI002555788F|nr:hypothetical protein [Proteiniborus sp. MB09-C3]WIV10605.1 hypothetical protein QO263_10590 [Proteiniborus sp. MB09-C3]
MIIIGIKEKINKNISNVLNSLRKKRVYNTYNNSNGVSFYRKQLNKVIICILIILAVLIIKKANIKFTNNIIRIVDESVNYSFDIKEDTKKIFDFVKGAVKIPDKVIETFNMNAFN